MKKVFMALLALGLFTHSVVALSQIHCLSGENHVTGYFGVNPFVENLPPIMDFPGAATAELVQVQLAWLAGENEYRDQEITVTDYQNRTQTDVDVYDGEFGGVTPGLREAALLASTNFERGQLDIEFCMPDHRDAGLIFGVYAHAGEVVGLQVSPFYIERHPVTPGVPPPVFRTTAVLNSSITEQVAREFNDATAETVRRDIETVTGVYPPRYLVESIFQREISATFRESLQDAALFHNPNGSTTVAANMLLTADHLVVTAPHSVTRVEMDGENILDENNQIDLRNAFLPPMSEITYGEIGVFVYDEGSKRPALVMSASPCGGVTQDASCETGGSIALYCEQSPLHTIVEFWRDDQLIAQMHNQQGNVTLDLPALYCNSDWTIRDFTCFRDEIIYANQRGIGGIREVPDRQFCQAPGYDDDPPPGSP